MSWKIILQSWCIKQFAFFFFFAVLSLLSAEVMVFEDENFYVYTVLLMNFVSKAFQIKRVRNKINVNERMNVSVQEQPYL